MKWLLQETILEKQQRGFDLGALAEFRAAVSRITLRAYGEDDDGVSYEPNDFGLERTRGWSAWQAPDA